MKPGRVKKLKAHLREISEADFERTNKHNRGFAGMLVWDGPYEGDFIGYLSTLLDPSVMVLECEPPAVDGNLGEVSSQTAR